MDGKAHGEGCPCNGGGPCSALRGAAHAEEGSGLGVRCPAASSWGHVKQVQEGNVESFTHIYRRYVSVVHAYLAQRAEDWSTAQDMTSETFLRAFRGVQKLEYQGKPLRAWLLTIARNVSLDYHRRNIRRLVLVDEDSLVFCEDLARSPEQVAVDRISCNEALAVMDELSEVQRQCLALRFLYGLSVAETACEMCRTEEAVRALQHRALRKLGLLLSEPDGGERLVS